MNEDEALLAAFLADPEIPAARAYAALLEERQDPRAEYLRLVTGLEQPKDTRPGKPEWRLRVLRSKIAPAWIDQVDHTRVATGGVYQSEEIDGAWHYLRFYPDRSVLSTCSSQTPAQVWRSFDEAKGEVKDDHTLGRGVYSISYERLSFSQVQEPPDWLQQAWRALYDQRLAEDIARDFDFIAADVAIRQYQPELARRMKSTHYNGDPGRRTMRLEWLRPLDESRGGLTYQFVAVRLP